MNEIYGQAKKVRIWLGEADADTLKTFTFLQFIAAIKRTRALLSSAVIKKGLAELFGSESLQPIEAILCSSWFGRRWIIQEAILGHSIIVHSGR